MPLADPAERLRAMLHQISWHAADAASHPDRTVEQLRAELRRIAAIAGRIAEAEGFAALSGYELGIAEGRRLAAAELRAEADDESMRTNRTCCSHAIESWLREAARIAEEGHTDG